MIQEIAFHFGRDPLEVIDAYEFCHTRMTHLKVPLQLLFTFFDDVAVGQPAKLVLLDTELHGHSFEVNYVTGPTPRAQSFGYRNVAPDLQC